MSNQKQFNRNYCFIDKIKTITISLITKCLNFCSSAMITLIYLFNGEKNLKIKQNETKIML